MRSAESVTDTCPGENALAALAGGRPTDPAGDAMVEHLAGCARCRGLVALVSRQSDSGVSAENPLFGDHISPWTPPATGAAPPRPRRGPTGRGVLAAVMLGGVTAAVAVAALGGRAGRSAEPSDPASEEAVASVFARAGLPPTGESPAGPRRHAPPALLPLAPRGALRVAPAEVILWATAPVQRAQVVLAEEGAPADAVLARWSVANALRSVRLAFPAGVALRAGGRYVVRALHRDGHAVATAEFRMLGAAEAAEVAAEESRIAGLFPSAAPRAFARCRLLLARGLASEALREAESLAAAHPGRRAPASLCLAALESAGLGASPEGVRWREALDAGRR